ncbi:RAS guanyl-releasing protein 2-B isoform X3 [Hydra vulgaris]|uniref:RAS guanyl-releasing protein 2-B isoform X3 n=1 Tax=Hydra vulgaris TaxID=6087 RepID=A0ABM4C210_HYDVU
MDESLIFEEDGEQIKAASVEQLINHCLKCFEQQSLVNSNDAKFVEVFFITYHWYITSEDLLTNFIDRTKQSKYDLHVLSQVYYTVKYWIVNYGSDFENKKTMLSILDELNGIVQEKLKNGTIFTLNIEEWLAKRAKSVNTGSLSRKQSLNFNDVSSTDFANHLHYLIFKGFRKISIEECKCYGKSASALECPNLRDQISLFNDISKYVIAMVLSHNTPELRAKSIHKFIEMTKQLLKLNDFNAVMAVVGGLGHSALLRLNKTKEFLSPEDKLFIKETQEILSSDQNYAKYRSMADQVQGFTIPVLGVVMKDLIAMETAVGDFIKEGELLLINFRKMVQLSSILEQLLKSKKMQPEVTPVNHLLHVIRVSLRSRYTEDDLYDMSMQREPRENKASVSKSPTSSSSLLFSDWAKGSIDEPPNRDTVEKHVRAMVNAVFNTYDVDKNGFINEEEFDALATNFPFLDKFAVLDVDCDGNISRQEMLNYFMNVNSQQMTKEFVHDFQEHGFYSPHYCFYCTGFLWGIGKSGFRCKICHITCHKECKSHVVLECKPVRQSQNFKGGFDSPDAKIRFKTLPFKKRLKEEWRGSFDSQSLYAESEYASSDVSDVNGNGSPTIRRHDMTRDRLLKLELEKNALVKENNSLKAKLMSAEETISELQAQLNKIRQRSSVTEQFAKQNISKTETEV